MRVKELILWLAAFEDQEAEIEVVKHTSGKGYYDQGGNIETVIFDPRQHSTYSDMRGNQYVKPGSSYENSRTLLLGAVHE
jgi:hypothetical protein